MSAFPARSSGVLSSAIGEDVVVYDLVTETVHWLNATAGAVLAACDGSTDVGVAVSEWAASAGTAAGRIEADVEAVLSSFHDMGLVGRAEPFVPPEVPGPFRSGFRPDFVETHYRSAGAPDSPGPSGSPGGLALSAAHAVIDHRVAFVGPHDLIEAIDGFLGAALEPQHDVEPTVVFEVDDSDGPLVLHAQRVVRAASLSDLLEQLPAVLNEWAVATPGCLTLHSGGVRSPGGEIVLLPAPSGSGKSTLTGALVAAGWDYLSDEAIGVRAGALVAVGYPKPLSLSPASRDALGLGLPAEGSEHVDPAALRSGVERLPGDVGRVGRVVLPTRAEGVAPELVDLGPRDALTALLANTLNLAYVGQVGLDTLCDLAESVPVQRFVYGDVGDAVAALRAVTGSAGG